VSGVSVRVDYTAPDTTAISVNATGATTARGSDTFAYDQANRLMTATVAGVTETYVYDGDGVRFSRRVGAGPVTRSASEKRLQRCAVLCNSSAMRRIFSVESKKKLWRPCREARALGL